MYVIHHAHLIASSAGPTGISREQRFCAAGPAHGVADFEVWMHTLPAGAETPEQQHVGAFAALVLAGSGKLLINGGPVRFQSPCTLVVPPGARFRIVNNAAVPMQVVSVFTTDIPPA